MTSEWTPEIKVALAAPFESPKWVVVVESKAGKDALWAPFIDRIDVQDRLDAVVGPGGWGFAIEAISPECVIGRLTVLGVSKSDVGDGKGTDSPLKSAASDALKRAAVHFGIGRHLGENRWVAEGKMPEGAKAGRSRGGSSKAAPKPEPARAKAAPKPPPKPEAMPVAGEPLPFEPETGEPSWGDKLKALQKKQDLDLTEILDLIGAAPGPGDPATLFRKHVATITAQKQIDTQEAYRLIFVALNAALAKQGALQ